MEVLIALTVLGVPLALFLAVGAALIKPEARDRLSATLARFTRSLPGRLVLLVCTLVALMIPLQMVDELRQERGWRLTEVQDELAREWGGQQTVVGPMLWVPVLDHYEERVETTDKDGNVKVHQRPMEVQRNFMVLPETLVVDGQVSPRPLHRGLYDVLVYDATVTLDARFARPEFPARAGHRLEPLWNEAQLVVELSDLTAVSAVDTLDWQGAALRPEAGNLAAIVPSGISAGIGDFSEPTADVRVALRLRGMGGLHTGPVAEATEVSLAGAWDAPSFTGFTLPAERTVNADAFSASWTVPGVARPVPQLIEVSGRESIDPLRMHTVGVFLMEPASPYVSVERAITYGMLVIVLCLLTFLVLEHGLGLALHPVQWLVNGLALVVFYLVLLATSEHQGFDWAYGLASAVTIGLITLYSLLATRSLRAGAAVLPALGALYACMYAMLRSEDHALLMGTGLVVVALACTMWVTRHLGRATSAHQPFQAEPAPAK